MVNAEQFRVAVLLVLRVGQRHVAQRRWYGRQTFRLWVRSELYYGQKLVASGCKYQRLQKWLSSLQQHNQLYWD